MARIRQQHPGDYKTSANIGTEFENLYRYVAATELGNKTLGELLAGFVDDSGNFSGPIELRYTSDLGLQFRVGTHLADDDGWESIASPTQLKGVDGTAVGDVTQSPIAPGVAAVSTASQTTFDFIHGATDQILAYKNGALQRPGLSYDYTTNHTGGTAGTGAVIFNAAQTSGNSYQFFKIRSASNFSFVRNDIVTTDTQSVFTYDARLTSQDIVVYRNGILQREGGLYDYTRIVGQNVITFNAGVPSGNTITVTGFTAPEANSVPGLMLARNYADPATGLIRYDRLAIAANQIANDRVNGLAALTAAAARLHIGSTQPVDPTVTRLWIDTSSSPSVLKAWDGTIWLATSVASVVPPFTAQQANQFLKVNGTGTAASWSNVDFSSVVPRTWVGAANGVAGLDSVGRLPTSQLPAALPYQTVYYTKDGAISGGIYTLQRIFGQRIRIIGFRGSLTGGTCSAQINISGLGVGATYTLSASPVEQAIATPIEVDASIASRAISVEITSPAASAGIEIALACQLVL